MTRSHGTKCPHREIKYCPLYIAMHIAYAGGCDDGRLAEGSCAVERGMDYSTELARLEIEQFEMVAKCQWHERADERVAQVKRNLAGLGLH